MHFFKKFLAFVLCLTFGIYDAAAQAYRFEVVDAQTGKALNTLTTLRAGVAFDVTVRALDKEGKVVTDYNELIFLTLLAESGQESYAFDTATAGEINSLTITPRHAATARTEFDNNRFPVEVGMRFKVTDGNITTDNASGFFSIAPRRFALTYTGSNKALSTNKLTADTNKLTAGRTYLGRITAYNADNSVASGYRGTVSYGLTPVTSFNSIVVTSAGGGYSLTTPPVVSIIPAPGDPGTGATAKATVGGTISVVSIEVQNGGSGYTTVPKVTISGGGAGARGATAVAVIADGKVTEVNVTNGGSGYDSTQVNLPVVAIEAPPAGAANVPATAKVTTLGGEVVSVSLDNPGAGYIETPTIVIDPPPLGGLGQAQASMVTTRANGFTLNAINLLSGGSGYDPANPPVVSFIGGGLGSGASATAAVDATTGAITSIMLDNAGANYTELPSIIITDPAGLGKDAAAAVEIALAGASQTAQITFGGIVDDVPMSMGAAESGLSYNITDGISATLGASAAFDIETSGGGSRLSVDALFFRKGGSQAGQDTTLNYRLTNSTNPAITVAGPIDTQFNLIDSNNVTVLSWSEESRTASLIAAANSGNLATSFILPFNLTPGTYTLEVLPGYSSLNRATIPVVIANPPDLWIQSFDYATGEYRGGDAFRFDLMWLNNANNGTTAALSSAVAATQKYMIEIHLSINPTYGDGDDFLIWQETFVGNDAGKSTIPGQITGRLLPGQMREISRNAKLPENFDGTYYLFARINSSGGRDGSGVQPEFLPGAITWGNNTTLPLESQKITILPKQSTNTFRVSLSSTDTEASSLNDNSAISRDGQYVVFESLSKLDASPVQASTNNIYVRNISANTISLVSVGVGGAAANGNSANPEISANGRYVVFQSSASNLVPDDTNNVTDIFVRDLELGITRRLSVNPATKEQANNGSQLPSISEDGTYVAFESLATNLSPTVITGSSVGVTHIYVVNRDTDGDLLMDEVDNVTSALVTQVNGQIATRSSTRPRISGNGDYIAFVTTDRFLLSLTQASTFNQIVRWDRKNVNTFLTVSRSKDLVSGLWNSDVLGNNESSFPAINRNGSYVAFASRAKNLTSDAYTFALTSFPHVFRAEIGNNGTVSSILRMNSVKDPVAQTEPDNASSILDLGSFEPSISDDGTLVTFASESTDLLAPIPVKNVDRTNFDSLYVYNYRDANNAADVYLYDLTNSASPLVSRASVSRFGYEATTWTVDAGFVNQRVPVSRRPVISGDGRFISFTSDAKRHSGLIFGPTNFDYIATNDARDIYVYDRKAGLPAYSNLPQVTLMPPGLSELSVGQIFTFVANASSTVRSIASVEFYANNRLIGTANSAATGNVNRFSVEWTAPSPGAGNTSVLQYQISAIAVDSNGLRSNISNFVGVTVNQVSGSAPSVAITSPVGATTGTTTSPVIFPIGSSIPFFARVTPGSAAITSVKFYATNGSTGANLLGTATSLDGRVYGLSPPYSTVLAQGSYTLSAVVSDGTNIIQSNGPTLNVTAAVPGSAPSVTSTFPSPGQTLALGASLNLQTVASDSDGVIASVAAYANGVLVGTSTSAPFSIAWTPSLAGTYSIAFFVTDAQGATTLTSTNVRVASAVGDVPTTSLLFPLNGNNSFTNASTIPLVVNVVDSDQPTATVPSITFYVDGVAVPSLPVRLGNSQAYYVEYSTNLLTVGAHTALAVVRDAAGNTVSSVTTFTVTQAVGSSFIAKPALTANGATAITITAGDTFRYQLEANKPNGRLSQMEIFLNGVSTPSTASETNLSQNPVTAAPFVSTFYAGQLNGKSGTFALATDNLGNVMVSNLVEITRLDNGEPTVTVVSPIAATTLTFGQTIVMDIEAKVTTAGDIIKSVIFLANSSRLSDTLVTRLPGTDIWRLSFLPSLPSTYSLNAIVTTRGTSSVDPATGTPFERSKTSNAVTFTVNPVVGIAPTVTLISPASTTTSTGGVTTVVPFSTAANSKVLLVSRVVPGAANISQVEYFARSGRGGLSPLGTGDVQTATNTYQRIADPLAVGTYDVFAVVTDSAGNKVQSNVASIDVIAPPVGSAPTGNLVFPVAGSVQTLGQNIPLQASANDDDGAIASVRFYANGILIDTDTTSPFTGNWSPTVAGKYSIVLVITDAQGATTVTDPVSVTVNQSSPPSVSLVSPAAAATYTTGSTVPLVATASDIDGSIASVGFYADGALVATGFEIDGKGTYVASWQPVLRTTPYALTVKALDNTGLVAESPAVNISILSSVGRVPSVSVTSPGFTDLIRAGSTVRLAAQVTDADFNFASVEFFVNGVSVGTSNQPVATTQVPGTLVSDPTIRAFTLNWTNTEIRSYSIVALARDIAGNRVASFPVTVQVAARVSDGIPTVSLTTNTITPTTPPGTLSRYSGDRTIKLGESLSLVASAGDSSGTLDRVDFYANGQLIGSDDSAPYQGSFAVVGAADVGDYQIYAIAVDSDGNQAASNSIIATVASEITPVVGAGTNDLFVNQVLLDGDQNVELNPGDPIKYTVAYGRNVATPGPHQLQSWRVHVYLSTDGDPANKDNFELDFFDGRYPIETIGRFEQSVLTNRLPANFTGTYYLIANIVGASDGNSANNFPSVFQTATARITIRPADMPIASRISVTPSEAAPNANEFSESGAISADGRYVVFQSEATNLVTSPASIPAGVSQIYIRDTLTNQTTLISQFAGTAGNAESKYPAISALGLEVGGVKQYFVAYQSSATNLIGGTGNQDTNGKSDIFLYNLATGVTQRISVPSGAVAGTQANNGSFLPSISGDGRYVTFESDATNLVASSALQDTNLSRDIYLYDRGSSPGTSSITALSTTASGVFGSGASSDARISEDGNTIVFRSFARNLAGSAVPTSYTRSIVYAKTRATGVIAPVSLIPLSPINQESTFNDDSFDPAVSANGRYVAFATRASNYALSAGVKNTSRRAQVYVVNRAAAALGTVSPTDFDQAGNISLSLVSAGRDPVTGLLTFGEDDSLAPVISGNGRYIGYRTEAANLQPLTVTRLDGEIFPTESIGLFADFNNTSDVYLRDMVQTASDLISVSHFGQQTIGIIGSPAVPASRDLAMSSDGRYFVFTSDAHNTAGFVYGKSNQRPLDTNSKRDVFLIDRRISTTSNAIVGLAPSITLTLNQATATTGSQLLAYALATDQLDVSYGPDGAPSQPTERAGSIKSIQIYANGLPLSPVTTPVLDGARADVSAIFTTPRLTAPVEFYAVATDSNGNTTFSNRVSVTVTAATFAAPSVILTGPVPSTAATGQNVLFSATTSAATGTTAQKVDFYANGTLAGTDAIAPFTLSYSSALAGSYSVQAVVTDSAGNTAVSGAITLAVSAPVPPSVSISSAASTVTLGSTLAISASASDSDGTISSVTFKEYFGSVSATPNRSVEDRLAPYGYQFNPTQSGTYLIVAEAADNQGNVTSSSALQIVVNANATLPTIQMISPVVGITAVIGQATTLEAAVTLGTGASVNQVNFYANGTLIGAGVRQGLLDRYRFVWQPSVTGSFQLTAEVVDSYGARGETSTARLLTVIGQTGALPFVEIIQPVPPATTGGGATPSLTATTNSDLNLVASAVDSDGTMSSVEFFLDRGRAASASATITVPTSSQGGGIGFIGGITVSDAGAGYLSPPSIIIIGDGVGATAEAEIANGAISRVRVTNRGSGYTNAFVEFVGGGLVEDLSIGFAVRDFSSDVWRLPTPFNFKAYGSGFYTFRAVAKDNNNNAQESAAVSVTVNPAPLTTPVTGNVVSTPATSNVDGQRVPAGQAVQLALNPTVVGGTVASVEFFANGESVGVDTDAPYIVSWVPGYVGSYNVIAVVTDSVGNKGVSPSLPVYIGGNLAPSISLIRPALSGATGVINQPVLLEAEALARTPGASISTVEFNADGVSIGIAQQVGSTNRFILSTWRPSSVKSYAITARVVDSFGQAVLTAERAVAITASIGVIPTVVLTAPSGGGTGGTTGGVSVANNSTLFLSAQANDADGTVANVEFLISRGQQAIAGIGGTGSSGLTFNGGVSSIAVTSGGSGYLYAPRVKIVGNGVGATAEATVTNGAVTSIRILSSGSGYTSRPQVVIEGGGLYENLVVGFATRSAGTLTWSSSLDLRNYDVGPYFFSARATDNQGNTVISSATAVTISAATAGAPSVSLAVPSPNVTSLGQTTNLVATPLVSTGATITKVDFFANGTLIGTASAKPYLLAYTAPASGVYTIYAVVSDSSGNTAVSAAQTLTVTPLVGVPPTVTVQVPTAVLSTASVFSFRASATDTDGTISRVEFYLDGESVGQGVYDSASATWVSPVISFASKTAGIYSLNAVAIDNNNNRASSAVVPITINVAAVAGDFGTKLNQIFYASTGRNATDAEQQAYFDQLGVLTEDHEFAAAIMQTAAFDFTGAIVINAYRAVFGSYPTFFAYQNGLSALNGGATTAGYIDALYASGQYVGQFGALPSFATTANREAFASRVHTNLTGVVPSAKIKGAALSASSLTLTAAQLAAARQAGSSEKSLVTAAFDGLTSQTPGAVVASYILSLTGTTQIPAPLLSRARVAGVILVLNEPTTAFSFSETEALRSYPLLDVAELYGTGTTSAAIKPVFRTLPASTSVVAGGELKLTAVVISPVSPDFLVADISQKWTFGKNVSLTSGLTASTLAPVHVFSFTIPAASAANAGSYLLSVSNRNGTVSAPAAMVSITPLTPISLPGVVPLKVGVAYSLDLGADVAGMTYVVKGLPKGLKFNAVTGVISGTPTKAGSYTMTYSTKLGKLSSSTQRATFVVTK